MDLPLEVVIEILNYLDDPVDLKSCLLVSRNLKELIIKTPKLMRKLDLNFQSNSWMEKLSFIDEYGCFVKSLKMESIRFEKENDFFEILKKVPNIEKLEVTNCDNIKPIYEDLNLVELANLTLQKMENVEFILKSLKSSKKLKVLVLKSRIADFSTLVVQQDKLEELTLEDLDDLSIRAFLDSQVQEKIKFRLKKLSICCDNFPYLVSLESFLRSQASTITDLSLCFRNMNYRTFCSIVRNFNALKNFEFHGGFVMEEHLDEMETLRMESVTGLYIAEGAEDPQELRSLVNIFPNIKTFKCLSASFFSLDGILNNFQQLSSIDIRVFAVEAICDLKFPNLKSLKVNVCGSTAPSYLWKKFFINCPNIENILIKSFEMFLLFCSASLEMRKIIENLSILRNLRIFDLGLQFTRQIDYDENEDVVLRYDGNDTYKVRVDMNKQIIEVHEGFHKNFEDEIKMLEEIFGVSEVKIVNGS